jgi:hypothetical protein
MFVYASNIVILIMSIFRIPRYGGSLLLPLHNDSPVLR